MARRVSLQGRRGAPTNENGFFRLLALPVGIYIVSLSHVSNQRAEIKDVLSYLRLAVRPHDTQTIALGTTWVEEPVRTRDHHDAPHQHHRGHPAHRGRGGKGHAQRREREHRAGRDRPAHRPDLDCR